MKHIKPFLEKKDSDEPKNLPDTTVYPEIKKTISDLKKLLKKANKEIGDNNYYELEEFAIEIIRGNK